MDNKPKSGSDRRYYMFAMKIVGDFGVTIALPVVVLVLIGDYLDNHYGFGPFGVVLGFVLAALISAKIIYGKARRYGREYQNLDQK